MTPLIAGLGLALSIGSEYGQTRRAREQGRIQSGFMQDALKDLGLAEQSLKDSIGSSLALPTLEAERALDAVSESGEMAMEQLSDRQDAISQATGFANIGMDEDSIKNIRKQFERKM